MFYVKMQKMSYFCKIAFRTTIGKVRHILQ